MAVVQTRVVDGETEIMLIRNHESDVVAKVGLIDAPAKYDTAEVTYEDSTGQLSGGTTKLVFRGGRWVGAEPALGGTLDNCAGGPTAWGTWLTCEEDKTDFSDAGGKQARLRVRGRAPSPAAPPACRSSAWAASTTRRSRSTRAPASST